MFREPTFFYYARARNVCLVVRTPFPLPAEGLNW